MIDCETAGLRVKQIPEVSCPEVKGYCSLILNTYLEIDNGWTKTHLSEILTFTTRRLQRSPL